MSATASDDIVFADEEGPAADAADRQPWTVLVVDDDPEIHAMTRFLLSELRFRDRPLRLLHANSAGEAEEILKHDETVALVMLDVVMETDDAGLRLAERIRKDLANRIVRIVIRTGQPGRAPERLVLLHYDIDDYNAKAEMTADRLFATVVTALRTFETIKALIDEQAAHRLAELDAEVRRAKLGAIAWNLDLAVVPVLGDAATLARGLPDLIRTGDPAALDAAMRITAGLDTLSGDMDELLQNLRTVG